MIDQILILKTSRKFIEKRTAEPYSFLIDNTALPSDNPLRFRKNLLE